MAAQFLTFVPHSEQTLELESEFFSQADGNPEPNITWTRLSDNSIVNMPLNITGKQDEGGYRCTADNGIGNAAISDVFITVQSYHPINTVFSTNLTNNTVNLNETFTLVCNADANPAASYRLYREQESLEEQSNGTYLTFVSTRTKQVAYKCIPFNSFGDGPSKLINVTVYFPAKITAISGNQSVTEGYSKLHLNCSATGEPVPNITWTRLFDRKVVTMPLMNIRKADGGGYSCTANNGVGWPAFKDVFIDVHSDGNPEPNITWTRLSDNSIVNRTLTITGKQDEGGYRCTADNGIGNAAFSDVFITVQYPPNVTSI
ncbi:neural cell adhesion molecule 1-like [Montipora foliosa]|uniref:neural cell adhesion molecule 1-like n=1 Tax=Montipora foliosa TaxID=591990 RepID=UPI0035F0FD6C